MNAQVLGISVDHVPCLSAWAKSLDGIHYPLLSDFWPHGDVVRKYGVLRPEGYSERAIFVIDRDGVIRYVDIHDIATQPSNQVVLNELRRIDPVAAASAGRSEKPLLTELPKGGIVMYCTRWCPACKQARAWFAIHNLKYTEVDVEAVPAAQEQVRAWAKGKIVTPTFDINGTIVVNFDERKLGELLL